MVLINILDLPENIRNGSTIKNMESDDKIIDIPFNFKFDGPINNIEDLKNIFNTYRWADVYDFPDSFYDFISFDKIGYINIIYTFLSNDIELEILKNIAEKILDKTDYFIFLFNYQLQIGEINDFNFKDSFDKIKMSISYNPEFKKYTRYFDILDFKEKKYLLETSLKFIGVLIANPKTNIYDIKKLFDKNSDYYDKYYEYYHIFIRKIKNGIEFNEIEKIVYFLFNYPFNNELKILIQSMNNHQKFLIKSYFDTIKINDCINSFFNFFNIKKYKLNSTIIEILKISLN
jgi:hypothetical protein